ncbi:MAG TPA: hypothetical protein VFM88_02770 [Vicinamibacteria bacterium]|nr:hypothetical protein [Vicinamibacteria bacterium]
MVALAAAALTLVLTNLQGLPLSRPTLERAVAAALADTGLALRWDAAPPGTGRTHGAGEVRIILLDAHPRRGRDLVLGSVLRERGRTHALWVYVGDVRRVLEGARPGSSNALQLSIAVGRVIAHEIAHLVAPRQPHAGDGLMGRRVDRRVLLAQEAPLDADSQSAIRSALAGAPGADRPAGAASAFSIPGALDGAASGLLR